MRKPTITPTNRPNRKDTYMKRLLAGATVLAVMLISLIPLVAGANHPPTSDLGEDILVSSLPAGNTNLASYWEDYFDGENFSVECASFSNHSGFIPAQYDAAVIKDGSTYVRVYADLTQVGSFTAIGAPNPNNQHPNRRFGPPHSHVIKCQFTPDPTTTTPEETTTTLPEETTTTIPEETTTTTIPEETTTTTIPSFAPTTTTPTSTTTSPPPVTFPRSLAPYTFCADGLTWIGAEFVGYESVYYWAEEPLGSPDGQISNSEAVKLGVVFSDTFFTFVGDGIFTEENMVTLNVPATDCDEGEVSPTSTVTSTPATLPFTGAEDLPLVFLASGLGLLGLVALVAARREDA